MFRTPEEAPSPQPALGFTQSPPEVGIIVAQPTEVPCPVEYAGRIAGFRDVEVRLAKELEAAFEQI